MIRKYGIPEWKVHELANYRKSVWRAPVMLNSVLTNKEIVSLGFMTMTDYYLKIPVNWDTALYRTIRTVMWKGRLLTNEWHPTRYYSSSDR
jgi:predicted signal transduction protein with EAL and GGDEF domain